MNSPQDGYPASSDDWCKIVPLGIASNLPWNKGQNKFGLSGEEG
jgi:hypothetical protein